MSHQGYQRFVRILVRTNCSYILVTNVTKAALIMSTPSKPAPATAQKVPAVVPDRTRRWLLLVHQLPSTPSNLRVRTWRRLQQLGAIAVKQAVYVLPDSATTREDFEWLKTEIVAAGGEASVFASDSVDAWSDDALVEDFRRARQEAYTEIALEIEQVLELHAKRARAKRRAPAARATLEKFRRRLAEVERVDFFGSAGRDRVVQLLAALTERLSMRAAGPAIKSPEVDPSLKGIEGRLWVTRPRPGVDRMASAWLIRRFIDPQARFDFVNDRNDRNAASRDALPFDMFGVELSHHGEHCTFETLCQRFAIRDASVSRLGEIVHDLDLKDGRFGAPGTATVGSVIEGLQLTFEQDEELLAHGITVFEALYRSMEAGIRRSGPSAVARKPARVQRRRKPAAVRKR